MEHKIQSGIRIITGALLLSIVLLAGSVASGGIAGQQPGPGTGSIAVSSVPTFATIYLDNRLVGVTPYTIPAVSPGNHTILLMYSGYASSTTQVTVQPGQTTQVYDILLRRPEPAQTGGSLAVGSTPAGATVFLDNRQAGVTPYTLLSLPAGNHTILITHPGYEAYTGQVSVQAGKTATVNAVLIQKAPPIHTTGSLKITTTPAGASLYLDNRLTGVTPASIPSVAAGQHTVLIKRPGYYPWAQQVTVQVDKTTIVSAVLILNPSIFY